MSTPEPPHHAPSAAASDPAALSFVELLAYEREELDRWAAFFASHPGALDVPFAEGRTATVRGVVQHIAAVERRYADRLAGVPVTPYEAVPTHPDAALLAAARDANARLAAAAAGTSAEDLARVLEFTTLSAGTQRASARKIVAHALLHGVRTWAQVATVLRQRGAATEWHHDLLFSEALT